MFYFRVIPFISISCPAPTCSPLPWSDGSQWTYWNLLQVHTRIRRSQMYNFKTAFVWHLAFKYKSKKLNTSLKNCAHIDINISYLEVRMMHIETRMQNIQRSRRSRRRKRRKRIKIKRRKGMRKKRLRSLSASVRSLSVAGRGLDRALTTHHLHFSTHVIQQTIILIQYNKHRSWSLISPRNIFKTLRENLKSQKSIRCLKVKNIYIKFSLSHKKVWGLSWLCQFIFKSIHIF